MITLPRGIFSPSGVDTFRQYRDSVIPYWREDAMTQEEFAAFLLRKFEVTPAIEAGRAVHKAIELAQAGQALDQTKAEDWDVTFALDQEMALPDLREEWIGREIEDQMIRGRVDAMGFNTIHDIKTTKTPKMESYMESFQWRIYLWMTGKDRFVYDVLKVKVDAEKQSVKVTGYDRLCLDRYPGLDVEVEKTYRAFITLVDELNRNGALDPLRDEERQAA